MKRFLKNCALFAFLFFLPLLCGEVYVRSLPNPAKAKNAYLTTHGKEIETLVLGSSHTYYGIAPQLLGPSAYNAAQVSQTWRYDLFVLQHYSLPKLKTVILPVSDFSYYEDFENSDSWFVANRYRLYMGCRYHSLLSRYAWECTAFPQFVEKLSSLYRPARMVWSAWGQGLEYTLKNRPVQWDNGEERALANHYEENACVALNQRFLEQIAVFCKKRNIRLLLISTPLDSTYRACQSPGQVQRVQQRIRHFVARHPEVRYVDFRSNRDFTSDDFYDADHLNTRGARKLTLKLRTLLHARHR